MSDHYFDGIGICLKCDRCDVPECCEQTEQCDGQNWAFMSNGSIQAFAREILRRRKENERTGSVPSD